MKPETPLPYPDCWAGPEEYVENLLEFATTSTIFQTLCGGVHILDFFTSEPGLFQTIVPEDWQAYLVRNEPMQLLDVLMRKDLDLLAEDERPPESLVQYIKDVRSFSLARDFAQQENLPKLTRPVAVGMKPKKIHEVSNFASYINELADDFTDISGDDITHFVDFGSGQNYLGRALASAPYNKHIVAVEGREHNIAGAKAFDALAGLAEKEKVIRNKKLWQQRLNGKSAEQEMVNSSEVTEEYAVDFRPRRELEAVYTPEEGKGFIRYISGRLESGDLSDVVGQLEAAPALNEQEAKDLRLMAISIHSCGNLSHHGIRSLVLNPRVRAVAIVGCCYNLMTEKLGPPTYKLPLMRPTPQPINGRVIRESAKCDPHGFPMSERLCTYKETGVRLNITARMMACQAPQNWGEKDSDDFFSRHFYRAVLQKVFLDKGVIQKVYHDPDIKPEKESTPFNTSTNPIIIGSLRKACYKTLNTYIRGAIDKLTTHSDYREQCEVVSEKMGDMTDDEIASYEQRYRRRKRELSVIWSLMAFSAGVVESLIVTDRWLFLKQHTDLVEQCWVESVFDFKESPRNLVVVGIKKRDS
ncbi:methyltransferase domain-containing protein [Apiospora sp. TS-2023a]